MGEITMTNLQKYNNVFITAFEITEDKLAGLEYQSIEAWDSVGHMGLIAELEDVFDIVFDTDDIIDFSSYEKGKELLKKYDVEI
jgi:acyl carrier protein